ncbi:arginine/serine-rich coiled-coil protein 2-like [Leptopilina heterotoma]|uniref:arginine/serine-rich coiled-coil protein 2-like n=1 Tax=Leptopilina heterotoma TaxID=63436 RepID=UPI001CA8926D|nr:arginine/serine-rich coiled-coil protein 2-like [Leptopilina heterotoma]
MRYAPAAWAQSRKHKKHSREDKDDQILKELRLINEKLKEQDKEIHRLKRKHLIRDEQRSTRYQQSNLYEIGKKGRSQSSYYSSRSRSWSRSRERSRSRSKRTKDSSRSPSRHSSSRSYTPHFTGQTQSDFTTETGAPELSLGGNGSSNASNQQIPPKYNATQFDKQTEKETDVPSGSNLIDSSASKNPASELAKLTEAPPLEAEILEAMGKRSQRHPNLKNSFSSSRSNIESKNGSSQYKKNKSSKQNAK